MSTGMITLFIVLATLILLIPLGCVLFLIFTKAKRDQRAEIVKNATMTTTIRVGANGRTIFENKISKAPTGKGGSSPPSSVLPYYTSQQTSSKAVSPQCRTLSQRAWQRLSRPFLPTIPVTEDDRIELQPTSKTLPQRALEPVSPMSPQERSSSWNTIDDINRPVSPLEYTRPVSTSIAEVMRATISHKPNLSGIETRDDDPASDIPLTPSATRPTEWSIDTMRARQVGERSGGIIDREGRIRENVMDTGDMKINPIQLQEVPRNKG